MIMIVIGMLSIMIETHENNHNDINNNTNLLISGILKFWAASGQTSSWPAFATAAARATLLAGRQQRRPDEHHPV